MVTAVRSGIFGATGVVGARIEAGVDSPPSADGALQTARRISDLVAQASNPAAALRDLNGLLTRELGVSVVSIAIPNRRLRRTIDAELPDASDAEALRLWFATTASGLQPLPIATSAQLLVPVVRGKRPVAVLRLELPPGTAAPHEDLLGLISSCCSQVLATAGLSQNVVDSRRRLTTAVERERIAREANDAVGQRVTAIGLRVASHLSETNDRAWRRRLEELLRLSAEASADMREAMYGLLLLQARRDGLDASLRSLVSRFQAATGTNCRLSVDVGQLAIPEQLQEQLFRLAHDALVHIQRHARADHVTVSLSTAHRVVTLVVRDDGVGIRHRDPFPVPGRLGLASMRDRVTESGGDLRVVPATPRGLSVEAVFPMDSGRRRRRSRGTSALS